MLLEHLINLHLHYITLFQHAEPHWMMSVLTGCDFARTASS